MAMKMPVKNVKNPQLWKHLVAWQAFPIIIFKYNEFQCPVTYKQNLKLAKYHYNIDDSEH